MNTNFVAFDFCDNDFNWPLEQSINYVLENAAPGLSPEAYREFILRGMVAFNMIRRLDESEFRSPASEWSAEKYRSYFDKNLRISQVRKLDELRDGFEGFVLDKNTKQVYFYAN